MLVGPPLSARQKALARSRTYQLLGRVFLDALDNELIERVQTIPQLAGELPQELVEDELAADHQHLFGFNVFPYQSIFLDPAGLLGGVVSEAVLSFYIAAGFQPDMQNESVDHIGHELTCLAFLCRQEARASGDELPKISAKFASLQQEFLRHNLLSWLPPLVTAIRFQRQAFYTALADLVVELTSDHWLDLEGDESATLTFPEPPDLLSNSEVGTKDIVRYLLTPAYSGLYLSRDDIGRLARQRSLPRGFGGREQMLQNLIRSAANYDNVETVFWDLHNLVEAWVSAYSKMSYKAALKPFSTLWLDRAGATVSILETMIGRLADLE